MQQEKTVDKELIAPCGINCAVCGAYLALRYDVKSKGIRVPYCEGCRPRNKKCAFLKKKCTQLMNKEVEFCYECKNFPCERLKHIDHRYRTYFHMSLRENLERIRKNGMLTFLKEQERRWQCPACSGTICCHNGICFNCGLDELKTKKSKYRWNNLPKT